MYVTWKNKEISLYNDNRQFLRKMRSACDVVNAVVNGAGKEAVIAVTQSNGKIVLYNTSGRVIRKQM